MIIRATFTEWKRDKAPRLGAALAYYAIFSIPPLLLIVIAATRRVYSGHFAADIETQFGSLVSPESAHVMFETAQRSSSNAGVMAGVFGAGLLFFGASGVFAELKDALNTIWGVQPRAKSGFLSIVREQFISFTMVLGTAFLLLVSLILSAAVAALSGFINAWLPGGSIVAGFLDFVMSLGMATGLFALMFKMLPDLKIDWKDVWIGAIVTAILFSIGKLLIGFYLGKSSIGSAYGAAGSVIVLIAWVYYSAQIFFFGAEFTKVYARTLGSCRTHTYPQSP